METENTQTVELKKSTNQAIAFRLTEMIDCPNSDNLQMIKIPDSDYIYLANRQDWVGRIGSLVVFISPDSLVNTELPQFSFLKSDAKYSETSESGGKYARIKARRLRGILSSGICVEAPEGTVEGEDCFEKLGILRYEAQMSSGQTKDKLGIGSDEISSGPSNIVSPKYDVDAFLKYGRKLFSEGELVVITQKINGCNSCFVYSSQDNEFHCKSRNLWKREYANPPKITLEQLIENVKKAESEKVDNPLKPKLSNEACEARAKEIYQRAVVEFKPKQNKWWFILRNTPGLMETLKANPDTLIFGEVYGECKGYRGDCDNTTPLKFRCFDLMKNGKFLPWNEAREIGKDIPWVPVLTESWPMDFNNLEQWYIGKCTMNPKEIREGCVIRGLNEKYDYKYGRNSLKLINPAYLEK